MDRQKNSRPCTLYPRMNRQRNGGAGFEGYCERGAHCPSPATICGAAGEGGKGYGAGCGYESPYGCRFPSLSMVYNAPQAWEKVYTPEKALQRGTAFQSLDLPFAPGKRCHK